MYLRLKSKLFLRLSIIHACLALHTYWYKNSSSGFTWWQVRHSPFSSLSFDTKNENVSPEVLSQSYAHCFLKNLALPSPDILSTICYDFRCRGKTIRKKKRHSLMNSRSLSFYSRTCICLTALGDSHWKSGNLREYFHKEIMETRFRGIKEFTYNMHSWARLWYNSWGCVSVCVSEFLMVN